MASATPLINTSSVLSRVIANFGGGLKLLGEERPQQAIGGSNVRPQAAVDVSASAEWNLCSDFNWVADSECRSEQRLGTLTSEQIELLIGETYRRYGFEVELCVARGAVSEGDLTLSRDGERILVRCRDWGVKRIGAERVSEFSGAIAARHADSGIFFTSGKFTRDARSGAKGKPLRLLEQESLEEAMEAITRPGENLFAFDGWLDAFLGATHFVDATCPVCCSSMVLQPGSGRTLGQWKCTLDPLCRGTREGRTSVANALAARDAECVPV